MRFGLKACQPRGKWRVWIIWRSGRKENRPRPGQLTLTIGDRYQYSFCTFFVRRLTQEGHNSAMRIGCIAKTFNIFVISTPCQSPGFNGPDFSRLSAQMLRSFWSISVTDEDRCQIGERRGCHRSDRRLSPPSIAFASIWRRSSGRTHVVSR